MDYELDCESAAFEDFSDLVRDVINEMGYSIEENELHEIEKDLRLLEENADVVDSQLFSCLLDKFNDFSTLVTDPEQSLQQIAANLESFNHRSHSARNHKPKIPLEFDELITHGYERLQEVYEDIKRYERLIEEMDGKKGVNRRSSKEKDCIEETDESNNGYNKDDQSDVDILETHVPSNSAKMKKMDGKENIRPVAMLGKLKPREEARMLNKFLKENALRRTQCPEPGRLPFKHDKQLKLEHYRRQWAKNPPPGEQKRMTLRWRIRELMTRRDIPHLRILTTEECPTEDENDGRESSPLNQGQERRCRNDH